jgi:hypothetical protein
VAAGSGTRAVQGSIPHSKSPYIKPRVGVGEQAAELEVVVEVTKPLQVGPH